MVDDVDVDRHPFILGEQVGDAERGDRDRGGGVHRGRTAGAAALGRGIGTLLLSHWSRRPLRRTARRELIAGATPPA
jgi:hypothetical protein